MTCEREPTEQEARDIQREADNQFLAEMQREAEFKRFLKWEKKRLKKPRFRDLKRVHR